MKRSDCPSIRHSVGAVIVGIASLVSPADAQTNTAADAKAAELGVMSISLKDVVQFNWGFQGQTQAAGTPNEAGVGAYLPIKINDNSVWFVDVLANANFSDIANSSSIVNTEVAGTTISTSTRLGYRWLNQARSWMYGINAGYDSRPMATGQADTGISVTGSQTVFFQQVAANLEAVSNSWNVNAYALLPVGTTQKNLNSVYTGSALDTYGLDIGYNFTPDLRASIGYYYQASSGSSSDGSGVLGRLAYDIANGLTIGTNLSYDNAFKLRFSADIKYRFGSKGHTSPKKQQQPVKAPIQALAKTPGQRDVRVRDCGYGYWCPGG